MDEFTNLIFFCRVTSYFSQEVICDKGPSPFMTGITNPPLPSCPLVCISYRRDSRPRTSSSLDVEWPSCPTFSMAHSSHPSGRGEMTNGGGHPHFNSVGHAGASSSSTRYLLKKQQRHRRRSSSPMGRVILINAPVDGEFRVLILVLCCQEGADIISTWLVSSS